MTGAADLFARLAGQEGLATLRSAEQQVALAERSLAEKRGGEARKAARAASEELKSITPLIDRIAQAEQQLASAREQLPAVQAQGYRVEAAQQAIEIGLTRLRDAILALGTGGAQAAEDPLHAGERAAERAMRLGPGIATLREENDQRMARIQQELGELQGRVGEERQRFEQVQRYNPESWSDIRGNGSEAEAALARAARLLQSAQARNGEAQDFGGAEGEISSAEQQVAFARTLLQAIADRLTSLQEAERLAEDEIRAAAKDIDAGWAFVRSNDADVGKVPEELLTRAAQALEQARAEVAASQPNWVVALQRAQEANSMADDALAGARSEREVMDKLREEVDRAEQAAMAEGQKLSSFVQLHRADIGAENFQQLQALLARINDGVQLAESSRKLEEDQRASALKQAREQLTGATSKAQEVYGSIYGDFQGREKLRAEVSAAVETATQSLNNANTWFSQYGGLLPAGSEGWRLLEEARRTLRPFTPQADANELRAIQEAATRTNDLAHRATAALQQAAQQQQQAAPLYGQRQGGSDLGDLLTGVFIGSMLGGGRGSYGGWGSGGGWQGGGSWGGGGDSGGGGFSGGSWGGGDSGGGDGFSGGDWGGGGGDDGFSGGGW